MKKSHIEGGTRAISRCTSESCDWVLHMQTLRFSCKSGNIMVLISQIEIDLCLNGICCVKTEARTLIWLDF